MSFIGGSLFLRKRRLDKRSCKSKQNFNKRWTFLRRCVRMWIEQDEGSFCMKKTGKKGLALLLSVLMAFSCMLFASAEGGRYGIKIQQWAAEDFAACRLSGRRCTGRSYDSND